MEGWKSYLKGNPAAGNTLIKADNPKMSDEQIAYAIKRLNELKCSTAATPRRRASASSPTRAGRPPTTSW